ncbi:hypothetical protein B0H14DRAFT_3436214 [Mycena olivaceomarginata]|nr:hypothetical protein B0H14DRAFT_3436214 [Mycena olivaceomarginata]
MEYNKNPALYPARLPARSNPVGIVVTPDERFGHHRCRKGLSLSSRPTFGYHRQLCLRAVFTSVYLILLELTRLNISAFAYSQESLADTRRREVRLADEIKSCDKWQVVCVDPEHLKTKVWREVSESPIFRANIIYAEVPLE